MRPPVSLHLSSLLVALLLALAWGGNAQPNVGTAAESGGTIPPIYYQPGERPPGSQYLKLTLPGTGFGVDERGLADPGGASHLNIPLGYTLSSGQFVGSGWALEADDEWRGIGSISAGMGEAGGGVSITLYGADPGGSDAFSGHAQAQIWPETRSIPAISAGVFDAFDKSQRSYYVAATKRLGRIHPKRFTFSAATPSWPPGPSAPLVGDPRTWGALKLLERNAPETAPEGKPAEVDAPFSEYPATLDGLLGRDWEDAALVRMDLPASEFFVMGVKRDAAALYCLLAVPSARSLPHGARAEVWFETPRVGAEAPDSRHRQFVLEWDARRKTTRHLFGGLRKGEWAEWDCPPAAPSGPRSFSGVASELGDGAWRFPVFEFAIPLEQLGADAGSETLGFCALVNLPAGQLPGVMAAGPEYRVQWPFGRGSYQMQATGQQVFASRPDLWGQVLFEDRRVRGEYLVATTVDVLPVEDGVLGPQEWAGADQARREVAPGVTQTVYLQRTRDYLHLASAWEVGSGQWQDQVVDLMVDPRGDQGIWPRDDDRVLRISLTRDGPTLETLLWHPRRKAWVPADQLPRMPHGMEHAAPQQVLFEAHGATQATDQGMLSVVEARIPLNALGIQADPGTGQAMGLAVETRVTAIPSNFVSPGSVVEPESGRSTFVTAGWGTGAFDDHLFYGVSHPLGTVRGIAEYDGDAINVGLTGALNRENTLRFTLGWSEPDELEGTPILGTSWSARF